MGNNSTFLSILDFTNEAQSSHVYHILKKTTFFFCNEIHNSNKVKRSSYGVVRRKLGLHSIQRAYVVILKINKENNKEKSFV